MVRAGRWLWVTMSRWRHVTMHLSSPEQCMTAGMSPGVTRGLWVMVRDTGPSTVTNVLFWWVT